jgi:hypothetical protein
MYEFGKHGLGQRVLEPWSTAKAIRFRFFERDIYMGLKGLSHLHVISIFSLASFIISQIRIFVLTK